MSSRYVKFHAKSARSKYPTWKKNAISNTEGKAKPKFSLKDASFGEIVKHFLEKANNEPNMGRNFLVYAMNLNRPDKETYDKCMRVLHYFDYVLIKHDKAIDPLPGNIWDIFENLLKNHDWFYQYKEGDKRYIAKQQAEETKIQVMYKNLLKKDAEKAKEIFNKYFIKADDSEYETEADLEDHQHSMEKGYNHF